MENVNAMLAGLGLKQTRLRRKMMDLNAAREGRENVATPREMMMLLEAIYRNRLFSKELTDDFTTVLATSWEQNLNEARCCAVFLQGCGRRRNQGNWKACAPTQAMYSLPTVRTFFAS